MDKILNSGLEVFPADEKAANKGYEYTLLADIPNTLENSKQALLSKKI